MIRVSALESRDSTTLSICVTLPNPHQQNSPQIAPVLLLSYGSSFISVQLNQSKYSYHVATGCGKYDVLVCGGVSVTR